VYINLAVVWIFLSRCYPNVVLERRIIHVCLDLDYAIVEDWLILDVENVSLFFLDIFLAIF